MRTLVYLQKDKLAPKGGPLAVGYYYMQEQALRGENYFSFLPEDADISTGLRDYVRKFMSFMPNPILRWQQNHSLLRSIRNTLEGPGLPRHDMFEDFDIIHFHQTLDLYLERNNLENYKGKVILQSHSPIPLGQEMYADLPIIIKNKIPQIQNKYEIMDLYAFERADYIVFPCKEACEPYFLTWPKFNDIYRNKQNQFRYVLTGIPSCKAKRSREEVLKELSIPQDGFVISYVGRHNMVKGFDLLKEISSKYLEMEQSAWVISAGLEVPITRLVHPRWKEIGFTSDAHSYISASDVFILPNRMTYFDIVMMEVLSLGKIVIASRTGGNKYFEKKKVEGVLLYDDTDDAVRLLSMVRAMTPERRAELGLINRSFYEEELTVERMYNNYISFLEDIENNENH